jgi:IMP and pyridine-specific 5'-nucleotidase
MTLYADGADFAKDSQLIGYLITLLEHGLYVAIVTAAGYGSNNLAYEKRLTGLLEAIASSLLSNEAKERFLVFGIFCYF